MAKFANNTLTQVAGFDGQILAQELVYDQKDFWNMTWSTRIGTTVTPVDLTGVTIDAQIIRRTITNLTDGRYGLEFEIYDYSGQTWETNGSDVTASVSSTNTIEVSYAEKLPVGTAIQFSEALGTTVLQDTTYYVVYTNNFDEIKISKTLGGSPMFVSDTAGGTNNILVLTSSVPVPVNLTITNRIDAQGKFTLEFDDDTWDVLAEDPELNIAINDPVCFSGRIKLSFPAEGTTPAYDESIFLLFLIRSDGVVN